MLGKFDLLDRMAQGCLFIAAFAATFNGIFMLLDLTGWYSAIPTAALTGPANTHFIRDVGFAYLTSGMLLGFASLNPPMRWLAAFAGGVWLSAHGAFHIWEIVAGVHEFSILWDDAPGVLGPPSLVWIALGTLFVRQRVAPAGIPRQVFLNVADRLAPDESAYVHEIAGAPGHALEKFKHFMPATMHRWAAPADLFHMARLGATLAEDCGPCAMTAAEGALRDGVSRGLINQALSRKPPDGALTTAFLFGDAIARANPEALALGDALEREFSRDVRLELAMTAATVRAYPAMKRGLGLSRSCSLVKLEV